MSKKTEETPPEPRFIIRDDDGRVVSVPESMVKRQSQIIAPDVRPGIERPETFTDVREDAPKEGQRVSKRHSEPKEKSEDE